MIVSLVFDLCIGAVTYYSSTSMLAAYFMLTIITIDSILMVLHSSVFLV